MGIIYGTTIGDIKGHTRSLDYGSCRVRMFYFLRLLLGFRVFQYYENLGFRD